MDPDHIRDIFSKFGPVDVRRMFGGAGIYTDGVMFALVADGVIYLKAGEGNEAAFEREGLEPFTYQARKNKRAVMSYRRMPDRLYDDPDELSQWAAAALAVARQGLGSSRKPAGKPAKASGRKKAGGRKMTGR